MFSSVQPWLRLVCLVAVLFGHALVIGLILIQATSAPPIKQPFPNSIMIDLADFPAQRTPKSQPVMKHKSLTPPEQTIPVALSPVAQAVVPNNTLPDGATTTPPASTTDPLAVLASELRLRIQNGLVYPDAARRRNSWGTVTLEVVLDHHGKLIGLRVVHSSGSAILDKAALNLAASVLPLPMPETLMGDTAIQIRVEYTPPR